MNKKIWNVYAPIYEQAMKADERLYRWMYERISKIVMGKDVLELATGPGLLARHIAPSAKSVLATDYAPGMINQALKQPNPANLKFEVADAMDLPYEDGTFDVVLIANALHLLPDPIQALMEIDRVLKAEGVLIAPNFIVGDHPNFGERLWRQTLKLAGISFEHQWTASQYGAFLRANGWSLQTKRLLPGRISLLYTECRKKREK